MNEKKLLRSATDRKIAGVCGGLGKYLGVDPTVIRVLWVLSLFLFGGGLLAYIVCALIIPDGQ